MLRKQQAFCEVFRNVMVKGLVQGVNNCRNLESLVVTFAICMEDFEASYFDKNVTLSDWVSHHRANR